jgi:hypothetical protein
LRGELHLKKNIDAEIYMERKVKHIARELRLISDENGYLFSEGIYRTHILPADLPEWYIHAYMYHQYGYIRAKGVKFLIYKPDYFVDNHLFKYDALFISYEIPIVPTENERIPWYDGYTQVLSGSAIVDFVDAAEKYSSYDVSDIRQEIEKKIAWYHEKNPND